MKIYSKRGVHNFREKELEKRLTDFFEKNPDQYQDYVIPTNFDELKQQHDRYCIEEGEIVSEQKSDTTHEEFRKGLEETIEPFPEQDDPMNRQNPIIRNYVNETGFREPEGQQSSSGNYSEPKSFEEQFGMFEQEKKQNGPSTSGTTSNTSGGNSQSKSSGTDPDAKVKKKSKRKFAKYAVDAVCALAERGIVWWATKDITDTRLQQLVKEDQISKESLEMLVMLDAATRGTVKEFFKRECLQVQQMAKYTEDEKQDLVEALEDFLDFKKVEINPTVNLLIIFSGMSFERVLIALQSKANSGAVLQQLKDMHIPGQQNHEEATDLAANPASDNAEHDPATTDTSSNAEAVEELTDEEPT